MAEGYDVVIAGAGIAGCAAAVMFGRQGLRVALVEAHREPSTFKRTCTHFIQPSALPTLQRLGIDRDIEAAGGLRNGFDFWTPYGWITDEAIAPGHAEHGYNIRRSVLDPKLRAMAADTPGVDLLLGHKVIDVLRNESKVIGLVATDVNGGRHELVGRLTVGADGRDSVVAERSGLPGKSSPNGRFGYFAHYTGVRLQTKASSQIWLDGVGVNYTFRNDNDRTVLVAIRPKEELDGFRQDLEGSLLSSFDGLPKAPHMEGASRVSDVFGVINYPGHIQRAAGHGVALSGDAAIVADYLWGVGCGWALQTAEWLVDGTAGPLLRGGDVERGLVRYRRKVRNQLGPHYLMISDYASGRPFNALERLLYAAAVVDPKVAKAFGRVGGRLSSPALVLSPAMLTRMVRARRRAGPPVTVPSPRLPGSEDSELRQVLSGRAAP
ncbi:MAG: hypothetical protein QOJ32_2261 [Frankiaceae bacterium]|nr:hypothetical protein [Frankiaceae bacterium]